MRRSKIFYIPSAIVINLFRNNQPNATASSAKIPEDAVVRSVQYIKEKDVFMYVLDHDSFDLIPEGKLLPVEFLND